MLSCIALQRWIISWCKVISVLKDISAAVWLIRCTCSVDTLHVQCKSKLTFYKNLSRIQCQRNILFPLSTEYLDSTRESYLLFWQRHQREQSRWDKGHGSLFTDGRRASRHMMQRSGSGFFANCFTPIWKHSNHNRSNMVHTCWLNTWRPLPCLPPQPLLSVLLVFQILTYKHLKESHLLRAIFGYL